MTIEGLHHFTIVYPDGFTEEWRPRTGGVKSSYMGLAMEFLELAGLNAQVTIIQHAEIDPELEKLAEENSIAIDVETLHADHGIVVPYRPAVASEVLAARDSVEVEESRLADESTERARRDRYNAKRREKRAHAKAQPEPVEA